MLTQRATQQGRSWEQAALSFAQVETGKDPLRTSLAGTGRGSTRARAFAQIVRNRNQRRLAAFDRREEFAMAIFGRKSRPARRRTNQPAWMTIDGSFAARQCTVLDISEGGARLRVEDPQFVKPQFHLKFDRASAGRACKVAWKKGDLIGIKFV